MNDRAICPSEAFPDTEIQERVPDSETVRTTRISLNVLGDGFVEAVADQTLVDGAREQCQSSHRQICGLVVYPPIVEAPGRAGVGRFGWKDQHASLLSFSGDAYLNEMNYQRSISRPGDQALQHGQGAERHAWVGRTFRRRSFARFIRASKAPPRDRTLANTAAAMRGSEFVDKNRLRHLPRAVLNDRAGRHQNQWREFTIPAALGSRTFHPFSDFLLHNVGTGDGIVIPTVEHYGRATRQMPREATLENFQKTENRVRTAPLWGVRFHSRLMHDGVTVTLRDAILRHAGESSQATRDFRNLICRRRTRTRFWNS